MNYRAEIRGLMAEANKIHAAVESCRKDNRRDREYWHQLGKLKWLERKEDELRWQAAQEFAALNGWRWNERRFLARTLVRGGTHDGLTYPCQFDHRLFDHPVFFREIARPHRTAAIVGQAYNTNATLAEVRVIAVKIGLELHMLPNLTASWWYPGSTRFFVFTRPEIQHVRFLPERMEPAHGACELPVPPQGAHRGDDG